MKEWPKNLDVVSFEDLVTPLRDVASQVYILKRQNDDKDLDYRGYNIGKNSLVSAFSPDEALTAKNLIYDLEEQGRDTMRVILGIAIQLGIEQGRRLAWKESRTDFDMLKMAHDMTTDIILKYTKATNDQNT